MIPGRAEITPSCSSPELEFDLVLYGEHWHDAAGARLAPAGVDVDRRAKVDRYSSFAPLLAARCLLHLSPPRPGGGSRLRGRR